MNRPLLIALCAVILWLLLKPTHTPNRFVPVPGETYLALDTRTGRYCSPWPSQSSTGAPTLPLCTDLATSWRWW